MKRPNGSGTVYKLKGRRRRPWIARKGSIVIGYYDTKKKALEALARVADTDITEEYNMTFADVFKAWSAEHYRKCISQTQIDEYNRSFMRMKEFHNKKMRDLHTKDYQKFADNFEIQTHPSLLKIKELVIQLCNYAMREEIITVNYGKFIQIPPAERKEKEIFTDLDIEKLKQDNTDVAKAIIAMIYTGLRISEFLGLTVMSYHETYLVAGVKTEAGRDRIIPLSPTAKKYIDYFVRNAIDEDKDNIIPWKRSTFRNRYKACLARLDIKYKSPHSTRHTFASICRREGMPPEILQRIIGHANYQTTANIYVHADTDTLISAVQKIG